MDDQSLLYLNPQLRLGLDTMLENWILIRLNLVTWQVLYHGSALQRDSWTGRTQCSLTTNPVARIQNRRGILFGLAWTSTDVRLIILHKVISFVAPTYRCVNIGARY